MGHRDFDARKFNWLGSITRDVTVCISWGASPIKTGKAVRTQPFRTGGDGADSDPDIFAKLYKNVFGAKIRLATGFRGTAEITLAMQRREVDGLCGISWTTIKSHYGSWVKDKKINVLLQAGVKKEPDLPNVPLAHEFARTKKQRQILHFVLASQIIARPFAAPPDLPADPNAILRSGFDETMKYPLFLAAPPQIHLDV